MVRLDLRPHRGNHARTFPHCGYLGLTPVTVSGSCDVVVEEDGSTLEASLVQVRVRCYETDANRSNAPPTVLWETSQTLWRASGTSTRSPFQTLPVFSSTWRLVIPVDAQNEGAASNMNFKTGRIWWALEGVIHHKPTPSFGSQITKVFPLNILSYRYPPLSKGISWSNNTPNRNVPLLYYNADIDSAHYGPGHHFSLKLKLVRTEIDPTLIVKKITVEIRRQITTKQHAPAVTPSEASEADPDLPTPTDDILQERRASVRFASLNEEPTFPPRRASQTFQKASASALPSPSAKRRLSYFTTAYSEEAMPGLSAPSIKRDDVVVWSESLNGDRLQLSENSLNAEIAGVLAKSKTLYHWSIGETCSTANISVRFYVSVKIAVKSTFATQIELPPQTITYCSVDAEARAIARDAAPSILSLQALEVYSGRSANMRRHQSVDSASVEEKAAIDVSLMNAERSPDTSDEDNDAAVSKAAIGRHRFASTCVGLPGFTPPPPHLAAPKTSPRAGQPSSQNNSRASHLDDRRSSIFVTHQVFCDESAADDGDDDNEAIPAFLRESQLNAPAFNFDNFSMNAAAIKMRAPDSHMRIQGGKPQTASSRTRASRAASASRNEVPPFSKSGRSQNSRRALSDASFDDAASQAAQRQASLYHLMDAPPLSPRLSSSTHKDRSTEETPRGRFGFLRRVSKADL